MLSLVPSPATKFAICSPMVGLGKTIEAGLIFRELKLRGLVKRVLVVAPKGLVTQWVQKCRPTSGGIPAT